MCCEGLVEPVGFFLDVGVEVELGAFLAFWAGLAVSRVLEEADVWLLCFVRGVLAPVVLI